MSKQRESMGSGVAEAPTAVAEPVVETPVVAPAEPVVETPVGDTANTAAELELAKIDLAKSDKLEERKMIPASDLIALKHKYEREKEELEKQLGEIKQKADTSYEASLQEQVTSEKQAAELARLNGELEQLREGDAQREELGKKVTYLETQLLNTTKQALSSDYGIDMTKLEGKTLADLKILEEAVQLVGARASKSYDTGSSAGTSAESLTSKQKIKQGLMERR